MKAWKTINQVVTMVAKVVSYISFIGIVAMMLLITVDVILRKLFNSPITGSYEIVQYMLMIIVFASFAYTQTERKHVRVTLFLNMMPWRIHTVLCALWELICAACVAICAWAAFTQGGYLLEKGMTSDVLRFSLFPFHYFEAAAMVVFSIVLLFDSVRYFLALGDREVAESYFREYS